VEHLASLRAIPNLVTIRPADANETAEARKVAVARRNAPTALILTRQNLPVIDRSVYTSASELMEALYIMADLGDDVPEIIPDGIKV
jgi:transketolase